MRIYYCGWCSDAPLKQLAAAASGRRPKRCGETAYYRCECADYHWDERRKRRDNEVVADHPKFLCHNHWKMASAPNVLEAYDE